MVISHFSPALPRYGDTARKFIDLNSIADLRFE
ncbi:hypothetical protein M2271_007766 [Streptomyces sp. LBL]|nr:hypothetical protein [Streptomyces sp. LBL]